MLKGQRGWLLVELLAACALLLLIAGLFVQGRSLQRQYQKNQVRVAAEMLAADLRQLQQQSMFQPDGAGSTLKVTGTQATAYAIYNGFVVEKSMKFAAVGCAEVYFSKKITSVYFSGSGSPVGSGDYVLRHKALSGFSCRLSLQPVTGRVTIYEEK